MADQRQYVERLLEVALYAPVGLALTIRDQWPRRLRQHRQALENRVQLARFVGELAVRYGRAQIERDLQERRRTDTTAANRAAAPAQPATVQQASDPPPSAPVAENRAEPVTDKVASGAVSADEMPIGNYESLAAIHVVQRLSSLRDAEIEQIRRFESTHRARRTVLAKIAQLQERTAS